jgi:hypothetical protein
LPSPSLDKSLIAQYFRTIADVDGLVNTRSKGVVGQFEITQIPENARRQYYRKGRPRFKSPWRSREP